MKLGLEVLLENPAISDGWGRCALLCNQASTTQSLESSWDVLHKILGDRLKVFFGPQHGFHATVQDNMIETDHQLIGPFERPVYSLYSQVREPEDYMLKEVDSIIIDIQIVGCRVYTFKYTIAGILRAAKRLSKKVVVLDRPNPLGGVAVEGRVLDLDAKSFVGEYEIPLRHGLTVAESALFFNKEIGADLDIIEMKGWDPHTYWDDNFKQWTLTSPNLPTITSFYVYPATVMLEGTNLSEGRGTGLPFQFFGAPYIKDSKAFVDRIQMYHQDSGFHLRPTEFQPTSQKWSGHVCRGAQIHVLNPKYLKTYKLGLAIMRAAYDLAPKDFSWKGPGYEYDFKNLPIDLILGKIGAGPKIIDNLDLSDSYWSQGIESYIEKTKEILIYQRNLESI